MSGIRNLKNLNDENDITIRTIKEEKELPYSELTGSIIVELKCCENLISEHQAQLFNYLKVSGLPVGLLVNFRRRKLDWKRLQSNEDGSDTQETVELEEA